MTLNPYKEIANSLYTKDDRFFQKSSKVNIRMYIHVYFVLILKTKYTIIKIICKSKAKMLCANPALGDKYEKYFLVIQFCGYTL